MERLANPPFGSVLDQVLQWFDTALHVERNRRAIHRLAFSVRFSGLIPTRVRSRKRQKHAPDGRLDVLRGERSVREAMALPLLAYFNVHAVTVYAQQAWPPALRRDQFAQDKLFLFWSQRGQRVPVSGLEPSHFPDPADVAHASWRQAEKAEIERKERLGGGLVTQETLHQS